MKKFGALLLTAVAGGCVAQAALVRQHNPRSEVEAGAVTISASAPMRWENVVGELRPEFNSVTARDYLRVVLPAVQQDVSSRREATAVQVGVDVSGETIARSLTADTNAQGVTTTTGRTTTTQNAAAPLRNADGSQVIDAQISGPGANIFRAGDTPDNTWPAQNAAVDPILQYRAAVALHQELVLLDNYLDSAYDPCVQEAWLVRTRLVATPYARNQPIDAYSRIYASYRARSGNGWESQGIRLVPLLVTDNFERSDSRRYEQLASQIQGSLNGVSGIVAAGLGFNRYLNNLNAILGSQYNNLLTISQIDDYTLMVRLGAAFSPTSRYEMQSRSYDITFLVVIDKESIPGQEPISLGFFAETEMRNAESGRLLQVVSPALRDSLEQRLDQSRPADGAGLGNWQTVRNAVATGIVGNLYLEDVQALSAPDELRNDLARWYLASSGSTAIMPVARSQVSLPHPQTGVFRDSLAAGVQARVVGPPGLNPNDLRAELVVGGSNAPGLTFAASAVAINPEGVIEATFPSLGALGINADNRRVELRLTRQCPASADTRNFGQGLYPLMRDRAVLAAAPVHAVSFRAEAVGGVATLAPAGERSTGDVRIRIGAIEQRNNPYVVAYVIQVRGGVLANASRVGDGAGQLTVDETANSVRVGRAVGAYNLSLASLSPGNPVTVRVVGIGAEGGDVQGEETTLTFTVERPPT